MVDLIELQKNNLLAQLAVVQTQNNLKYLVVDETTEYLIYSLIDKKARLRNVTAIERIDHRRKSQPSIDAVYIIDPTRYSLSCLKTDFKVVPPRYKSMAIYLLPSPTVDHIIKDFTHNNNPVYNKLIRFIKVFNFNLLPIEKRVFLTSFDSTQDPLPPVQKDFDDNDPKLYEKIKSDQAAYSDQLLLNNYSLQIFYNPAFRNLVNFQIDMIVNSLLNLCIITNEYPIVRYYSPKISLNDSTVVSKIIAQKFQEKIDNYLRKTPDFNPNAANANVERSVLLVTDRTIDLIELFLHEFNYEAMLYDFLSKKEFNTKIATIFYSTKNARGTELKRVSKLSEQGNDKYFEKYRHMHISNAYDTLNEDVNVLFEKNPMLVNTSKATTATDILHVMAHSQEFNEDRRLLTLHKQLIERMLTLNMEEKLSEVSDIEQIIAAGGLDINNQLVRLQHVTNDMIVKLDELKNLDITHRVRLIILYVLKKKDGILLSDLTKLFKFLGIYKEKDMTEYIQLFKNFNILNHDVIKLAPSSKHHHHIHSKNDKPKNQEYHEIDNTQFNTSRYKPAVYKIAQDLANNNHPELAEFPYANEANNTLLEENDTGYSSSSNNTTSLRNQKLKATWYTPAKTGSSVKRQKIFLYMVGGITAAEIKAIYDVSEKLNKDVFLGSENLMTPVETVFNIKNLNNTNPRELNPLIPHRLSRETNDKVPDYLFDNGFQKPPAPVSMNQPLPPAPHARPTNNIPAVKPEKKHKFGKLLRKSKS